MQPHRLLWAYARTRTHRFADRAALERHQARGLERFARTVLARSPWFAPHASQPRDAWPLMDKAAMLAHFDAMNTAGLKLDDVLACAHRAEQSRDFSPMLGRYSVGLSSGTSGSRGVFVASPAERATWAGVLLAKLLPHGLLHRERVALFLRANNRLYTTVRTPWLSFAFFDLFEPFESLVAQLDAYRPTIVVAPAQVLCSLAVAVREGRLAVRPARVIAVAEVLEPLDRVLLAETFGRVDEVYQATEGFLGATCAHGTLHLNEEFLHVEPQWLDDARFVPVITDFTRATQPIVRYRLDDVLAVRRAPCPCGSPALAIERIEGRCDDMLVLPARDGTPRTVFADVCARALAQALPLHADYRLTQTAPAALSLAVDAGVDGAGSGALAACRQHLVDVFARLGVATDALTWTLSPVVPARDFTQKRRRIVRAKEAR
ncbi:F390 synthetase-related protein [Burkholderia ubonensis]|uniref:F390 synthetase-related protein n=1 Tax=Burkholderia ubonensis TaxID=101571 RepID=UPI000759121F|nr:F390 synthetase-related protein [Burkholderia ubonensis]KVW76156.1 CoF synthetase [Burkholderia ubonensis]